MDYQQIKDRLSPCGINCGKCFAYKEGDIVDSSRKLKNSLGNFDVYAERFVELLDKPVFNKYKDFKEMLEYFSSAECSGCRMRNANCLKTARFVHVPKQKE